MAIALKKQIARSCFNRKCFELSCGRGPIFVYLEGMRSFCFFLNHGEIGLDDIFANGNGDVLLSSSCILMISGQSLFSTSTSTWDPKR